LFQIHAQQGAEQDRAEELQKMAEVLMIDAQIIDDGRIVIAWELIDKVLRLLRIPPTAVQVVIDFVESKRQL
jgi:hypothetical protein